MGELSFLAHWRNALRDSNVSATAKVVGFVLNTYMNKRGEAYPSKETLARDASVSIRSVHRAIDELEQAKLIRVEHSKGRTSNRYRANSVAVAPLSGEQQCQRRHPTVPTTTPNSDTVAHESFLESNPKALQQPGYCNDCETGGGHHQHDCPVVNILKDMPTTR